MTGLKFLQDVLDESIEQAKIMRMDKESLIDFLSEDETTSQIPHDEMVDYINKNYNKKRG